MKRACVKGTDSKRVPVVERPIESPRSVIVEDTSHRGLNLGDPCADSDSATHTRLQQLRCRQVISVHMGFQQPLHLQPLLADEVDHGLDGLLADPPAAQVEIQYTIDNRATITLRILDHVGHCEGCLIEKGRHLRRQGAARPGAFDDRDGVGECDVGRAAHGMTPG